MAKVIFLVRASLSRARSRWGCYDYSTMKRIFVALVFMLPGFSAEARCTCTCVNGQAHAVCTNAVDVAPPCAQMCPIAPPGVSPINPPTVPPIGTDNCRMMQIMNPSTGVYRWHQVCW